VQKIGKKCGRNENEKTLDQLFGSGLPNKSENFVQHERDNGDINNIPNADPGNEICEKFLHIAPGDGHRSPRLPDNNNRINNNS
jgi:hypothetical protein